MGAYHTVFFSLSLVILAALVLVLWFKVYRSNNEVKELLLKSIEDGRGRGTGMEILCRETKRQCEASARELMRLIAEEQARISATQKMLIEMKEKQLANGRIAERSLQSVVSQLGERMDYLEKRPPFVAERPGFHVQEAGGEKGRFLV